MNKSIRNLLVNKANVLWITLVIIVVFRLAIFLFFLNTPSFIDEQEYVGAIKVIQHAQSISPFVIYSDSAQPAFNFYPIILLNSVTHLSEIICLRIVAFIFGIGTLVLMALILKQKFNPLISSLSLLFFGLNPAIVQFSTIGWFNIQNVFFALFSFLCIEKLMRNDKLSVWFFALIIAQIFIFSGYLIGRLIGIIVFMVAIIAIREMKKKIFFIVLTVLFMLPLVYSTISSNGLAFNRIRNVTVPPFYIFNMNFVFRQIFPSVGGFLGIPYSEPINPDNKFYSPVLLGVLPFYFSPFMLIGLVAYAKRLASLCRKNSHLPPLLIFWFMIGLIVLGVNMLTFSPLNISRSLLWVPIHTFLIAVGLNQVIKKYHYFLIPLSVLILLLAFVNVFIYSNWFNTEFSNAVHGSFGNQRLINN